MKKMKKMKKMIALIAVLAITGGANAALVLDEHFDYNTGELGAVAAQWTLTNQPGGRTATVVTGTLSYLSLITSGKKLQVPTDPNAAGQASSYTRSFTDIALTNGGSMYFSFLANVRNTGGGDNRLTVAVNGDKSASVKTRSDAEAAVYGFVGNSTANLAVDDGVHLIVGKVRRGGNGHNGGIANIALWLDPTSLGGLEDGPADSISSNFWWGNSNTYFTFNELKISFVGYYSVGTNPDNATPDVDLDEIRVGTSWADVTPIPLAAPVAEEATNIELDQFNANWVKVYGATSYKLDVSEVIDFTSFVGIYTNYDVGDVDFETVTGLTAYSDYYYRVRAYRSSDSATSTNSETIFVESIPEPALLGFLGFGILAWIRRKVK